MKKGIRNEKEEYQQNSSFWDRKDEMTVVGDWLGRLQALKLLDARLGETILDAGCGAGWCTRRIAKSGAKVFGIDRSLEMLSKAIAENDGINYLKRDISGKLPFPDNFLDGVSCIAVLIHDSPVECESFFREAYRILKKGGRLVVSIMHPFLYQSGSPNRDGRASWAQYRPLEDKPMTESQRFEEIYKSSRGEVFTSTVWYHPENLFPELLTKIGFCVVHTQSTYLTPEVLSACKQTGPVGYPAFWQVMAKKGE